MILPLNVRIMFPASLSEIFLSEYDLERFEIHRVR